jgi:hypothetical protein
LTPAKSKLVEASSQLEEYKKPKGVDTTSLLAPKVDKSLEVDKSQGSESSKKQYETLLSTLKTIPDMTQYCKTNTNFIPISIFLVLAKQAIEKSTLSKYVIDTSLLESKYFLVEPNPAAPADAVTMNLFITGIIIHSILEKLLHDNTDNTQAEVSIDKTQAEVSIDSKQQPEQQELQLPQDLQLSPNQQLEIQKQKEKMEREKEKMEREKGEKSEQLRKGVFKEPSAFPFMNQGGGDITKDSKINCKLYQAVLDTISSFDLDVNSTESLRDILIKIIEYMGTDNFKKLLKEKWDQAPPGYDGGSSLSKYKKNKKSYKSHKSYHPKIGKTRKHHNTHNKPKRVLFVHQA